MGTAMEKYLYFRTVADEEDDDTITGDTLLMPVSRFTGMLPSNSSAGNAANVITLFFESVNNIQTADDNESVNSDTVALNITAGKSVEVMNAILQAVNSSRPTSDGYIVIADDATTTVGATSLEGNNIVKAAKYVSPHILNCGAITIVAANS